MKMQFLMVSTGYLSAMPYVIKSSVLTWKNIKGLLFVCFSKSIWPQQYIRKITKYRCTWKLWKFATDYKRGVSKPLLEGTLYVRDSTFKNKTAFI